MQKHAISVVLLVISFSIGDWFLLYQMNKSMNKRFFAEFLALLSIRVGLLSQFYRSYLTILYQINPDPDLADDPEIDIFKTEDALANGDVNNYFDEDELGQYQFIY